MIEKHNRPTMFCHACGQQIDAEAVVCVHCGVGMTSGKTSGKSKIVAALFALFMGSIGIHKFYVGRAGMGFLMILVGIFTLFIGSSIWAFIDFIRYLTMSDKYFEDKVLYVK